MARHPETSLKIQAVSYEFRGFFWPTQSCQPLNSRNWQILAPLGEFAGKKAAKIKFYLDKLLITN